MKAGNSQVGLYTILKYLGICGLICAAATASAQEYPPHYDPSNFGRAMAVLNDGNGNDAQLEIDTKNSIGHIIAESSATIPKDAELRSHFPWENEDALKYTVWLDGSTVGKDLPKGQYALCATDKVSAAGEKYTTLLNANSGELYQKYCATKSAMFQPAPSNEARHALRGTPTA